MTVRIYVGERLVMTTEQLADQLGKTPSAVRSAIHRGQIQPADYVTKNVPVYYPEDLGLEEPK